MLGEALGGGSDVDTAVVVGGVQFLPVPVWGGRGGWWVRSVGCLLASGKLFVKRGWFKYVESVCQGSVGCVGCRVCDGEGGLSSELWNND